MRGTIGSLALALSLILPLALCASAVSAADTDTQADLILRGGMIYAGDAPPRRGDVAVKGDRILYVGPTTAMTARRIIDVRGLIVAPGFIDPHAHVDDALFSGDPTARLVLPFLMQGVTTAFIGVDGGGDPDLDKSLGSTRDHGINFATYVGFGAIRLHVVGAGDRAPSAAEMTQMAAMVEGAMCQGALGLSTGLFYAPQSFATTSEVIGLARIASSHGGIYDSHIRDESSYSIGLRGAIGEALEIGRKAAIPVHIAHIKALGVDVQGSAPQIIADIEAAQRAGQIVHADQYPWPASGTALAAALLPRWVLDGGRAAWSKKLDDPALRTRLRDDMAENMRRRGGPASLLVTSGPDDVVAKTLEQIAAVQRTDPVSAAIALLRRQDVGIASFNQTEGDIEAFMKQRWVVTSSDASEGHPRYYASFARKFAVYVRARHVLDLQRFISQSSTETAHIFGLEARGALKPGYFADIIAFDPARFAPRADYAHPALFATGMRYVIVNGVMAVDQGVPTGRAAGRALPRRSSGTCATKAAL